MGREAGLSVEGTVIRITGEGREKALSGWQSHKTADTERVNHGSRGKRLPGRRLSGRLYLDLHQ